MAVAPLKPRSNFPTNGFIMKMDGQISLKLLKTSMCSQLGVGIYSTISVGRLSALKIRVPTEILIIMYLV